MGTSLFFQLFAGVPMGAIDTFPLIPLGRWLLPIGIYIADQSSAGHGQTKPTFCCNTIWNGAEMVEELFCQKHF